MEAPGAFIHPAPGRVIERSDRFTLVADVGGTWGAVEGIRLRDGEAADAAAEVQAFLARTEVARASWWLTERSTPPDVEEQLLAAGVQRVEDDYLHAGMLATSAPPEAPADVVVRRVETVDEFIEARRLQDATFDNPHTVVRSDEALAREFAEKPDVVFLGLLDGRAAGVGRLTPARCGGFLSGGATAPWARGRGVYRALVRARWDAVAALGTPALAVGAGPMSAPILRRLGFEQVLQLRRLESVASSSVSDV